MPSIRVKRICSLQVSLSLLARVAELADAADLKFAAERRCGFDSRLGHLHLHGAPQMRA